MDKEGFFQRWARLKSENTRPDGAAQQAASARADSPGTAGSQTDSAPADRKLPTLADVARLTPDSDFSVFVAPGVDQTVRRMALKKLFSDPHFNIMDGLDIYIDDYNKPSPMSPEMFQALQHAHSALGRIMKSEAEQPAQDRADDETEQAGQDSQHDLGDTAGEASESRAAMPDAETNDEETGHPGDQISGEGMR